jgi:hypothetical protein
MFEGRVAQVGPDVDERFRRRHLYYLH